MRKNLIAVSVAAFVGGLGMAGGAAAAVLPDNGTATLTPTDATGSVVRQSGVGHQLIVPYYNVQNGNATLLNVVNTDTVNGKAVKIRFRGGSNSDDVFDFQLLMSPGDAWTANISRGPDGRARLTTSDRSCTVPQDVGVGGADFVTARLPSTLSADDRARETREGYVEMFNMADIPPTQPNAEGSNGAIANPLFTAIKHVNGVAPCYSTAASSAALNNLINDPATTDGAYALGLRSPSASLFANWTIVNVPKAGSATGEATAITAVTGTGAPGRGNIVFFPQVPGAATTPDSYTADPSLRTVNVTTVPAGASLPIIPASQFDLPDLSTPYLLLAAYPPVATDPINYVANLQNAIAASSITNEYLTDPSINASTDWVFSQPTRRYSVAADYRPLSTSLPLGRAFLTGQNYYVAGNTAVSGFQICTNTAGVTYYDREEATATGSGFVISPNPPASVFRLCGETSVLTFNSTGASVLGAEIARTNFATGSFRDGWAVVSTPPGGVVGPAGSVQGLPILGKSFVSASTGALNVGGSWEHRYGR